MDNTSHHLFEVPPYNLLIYYLFLQNQAANKKNTNTKSPIVQLLKISYKTSNWKNICLELTLGEIFCDLEGSLFTTRDEKDSPNTVVRIYERLASNQHKNWQKGGKEREKKTETERLHK